MNIEELFKGFAVIFDDEIADVDSTISKIKENIEKKDIPVAAYQKIPQKGMIPSLSNVSFIILDWDYTKYSEIDTLERISIPETLKNEQEQELIDFVQELLKQIFIPVFIFTSLSVDHVKERLREASLWDNNGVNRIFIKQKNDVNSGEQLFKAIENWLKEIPSVYVLKEWERIVSKTKDKMFLELYGYSSNWVNIIWTMIKEDSLENHREFGEFITRTLNHRIKEYRFEDSFLSGDQKISSKELINVVQGERYFAYHEFKPQQAYTGDLFKIKENKKWKYYLNIRAQCDLSRQNNPLLYCIEGKELKRDKIVTEDIKITPDRKLIFDKSESYSFEDMSEICKNETKIEEFNKKFAKHRDNVFLRKGTFLERNDKVIIGCVADKQAIQFDLSICMKNFKEMQDNRIGRILPPYITRIQQKCSQYMIREGVMPVPEKLFIDFEN